MGDAIFPRDAKDPLETLNVEGFKGFYVLSVIGTGLITIEKNGDAYSKVDSDFGFCL